MERARRYFQEGSRVVRLFPNDGSRLTVRLLQQTYAGILDAIEALDYDVFRARAYVSTRRKLLILSRAWWAERPRVRLRPPPLGAIRLSPASPGSRTLPPPRPLAVRAFNRYFRSQLGEALRDDSTRLRERRRPLGSRHAHAVRRQSHELVGRPPRVRRGARAGPPGRTSSWMPSTSSATRPSDLPERSPCAGTSPRAAYDDLRAARALPPAEAALWIFPQGARRPQAERPERAWAAARPAWPGGTIGRFGCAPWPSATPIWVSSCPKRSPGWASRGSWDRESIGSRRALAPVLEQDLLGALDALDGLLRTESLGAFRTIVAGPLSINKRMDRVRHALGLLRGPFEARNG